MDVFAYAKSYENQSSQDGFRKKNLMTSRTEKVQFYDFWVGEPCGALNSMPFQNVGNTQGKQIQIISALESGEQIQIISALEIKVSFAVRH